MITTEKLRPQFDGGQHGARRRLAKSTQAGIRHGPGYILQPTKISGQSSAIRKAFQDRELPLRADLARIALAAGFVSEEVPKPL